MASEPWALTVQRQREKMEEMRVMIEQLGPDQRESALAALHVVETTVHCNEKTLAEKMGKRLSSSPRESTKAGRHSSPLRCSGCPQRRMNFLPRHRAAKEIQDLRAESPPRFGSPYYRYPFGYRSQQGGEDLPRGDWPTDIAASRRGFTISSNDGCCRPLLSADATTQLVGWKDGIDVPGVGEYQIELQHNRSTSPGSSFGGAARWKTERPRSPGPAHYDVAAGLDPSPGAMPFAARSAPAPCLTSRDGKAPPPKTEPNHLEVRIAKSQGELLITTQEGPSDIVVQHPTATVQGVVAGVCLPDTVAELEINSPDLNPCEKLTPSEALSTAMLSVIMPYLKQGSETDARHAMAAFFAQVGI